MKEERGQQNRKYRATTTKSAGTYKPVVNLLQKFQARIRPRESHFIDIREQKLHVFCCRQSGNQMAPAAYNYYRCKAEEDLQ